MPRAAMSPSPSRRFAFAPQPVGSGDPLGQWPTLRHARGVGRPRFWRRGLVPQRICLSGGGVRHTGGVQPGGWGFCCSAVDQPDRSAPRASWRSGLAVPLCRLGRILPLQQKRLQRGFKNIEQCLAKSRQNRTRQTHWQHAQSCRTGVYDYWRRS